MCLESLLVCVVVRVVQQNHSLVECWRIGKKRKLRDFAWLGAFYDLCGCPADESLQGVGQMRLIEIAERVNGI